MFQKLLVDSSDPDDVFPAPESSSSIKTELKGSPKASRPRQRWRHRKQPAVRARRQVQGASRLGPMRGTKSEEKGLLQHPVMSGRLPEEHSWDKITTIMPHPSHATERESTRAAVPHHRTSSRNISEEEMPGRTENSSVRRRKQRNEAAVAASTAPTLRPPHPTNSLAPSLGPQREVDGSVKGVCTCPGSSGQVQAPQSHQLALAQKGAMARDRQDLLQRPHDSPIPTPRTEEAVWAAAAITFLFVLLTLAVLYTRLYRNFRRSRSLYWDLGSDREGQETVSSVIKGRLLSHQSRRKRWQKQCKSPLLLHDGDSESSE
ncbi:tumor protein p53-inducible protein 13 [Microcaecilia unicolor]|uniref:Tumor protein p53-inducible protein 13 n=1 Tax=Microcaecilia unicolor TaxID=1415580 RepID=A0A6P7WUJ2_9AMPH|nr:tumor protein p53-inducible protein 13 [Microcaecilia unicolor]XP_030041920.1 tumor protein p53-inducible protein 13 [Microcaecilia unicolor]XP_030041921.1 tumor protein p53-inducible protein 13 [Microcaecilia unicolor]XP_030041922.1 tumor protein p53-inducible protein 13 [Microcaecilia unicolor]XP_030041923.1 tumor protein p53-inducible protein 13 [Microcaecilia unicolor]XP_030041924.1 tumor protein p53-inducible protein 13 [Microcaecilia unicolor]XP_030041925.1 tumor protein p53-inducibl